MFRVINAVGKRIATRLLNDADRLKFVDYSVIVWKTFDLPQRRKRTFYKPVLRVDTKSFY